MWALKYYESPDKIIRKEIYEPGIFGPKPTENSTCTVIFSEIKCDKEYQSEYLQNEKIIIGNSNTAIDRQIDNLLITMCKDEMSRVIIQLNDFHISFEIKLVDFTSEGYYFEWTADEKCKIAKSHKDAGVDLFKQGRFVDASHRFSRGLKLLLSIPVAVDDIPKEIDGVKLTDIKQYSANLYNNLASCYSKGEVHETVVELCTKVLEIQNDNSKALYKRGFAYSGVNDFERAKIDLERVLEKDANNKAVIDKLNYVNSNLSKQESNYANMVKKMFK